MTSTSDKKVKSTMILEYKSLLLTELDSLSAAFEQDQLAYLSLTSKPELVIRDALAFRLYRQLMPQDLLVAREWKHSEIAGRSDIAVLKNNSPAAIVELKSMYTFNTMRPDYRRMVLDDIEKAKGVAEPETQVFALILATHPCDKIDLRFQDVVKYIADVNRAYQVLGSQGLRERAYKELPHWCSPDGVGVSGTIHGGFAFGVEVSIEYCLYGPYYRTV